MEEQLFVVCTGIMRWVNMHKLYTTNIRHSQQIAHHTLHNIMNQCNELLARDKDEIHVIVKHMLGLRAH